MLIGKRSVFDEWRQDCTGQFALTAASGNSAVMIQVREPNDCQTMEEVRAGVDAVDRGLVALIARRFAFMDAAARIKLDRAAVRDERRKAEVISKVEAAALERGIDPNLMRRLYEELIESSIAYEFEEFDRLRSA